MIRELLLSCGLNKTEVEVFIFLATHGPRHAGIVAKGTEINRSTVYSALTNLVALGYVHKLKRGSTIVFETVHPTLLRNVIENSANHRHSEVLLAAARLPAELEAVARSQRSGTGALKVTVFESAHAVHAHLEHTLGGGGFCAIFDPQTACVGEGKKIHARFLERSAEARPQIREILVAGPEATWYQRRIRNRNHLTKVISEPNPLGADIICTGTSVLLLNYDRAHAFAIRIDDEFLARAFGRIFDLLWSLLPDPVARRSESDRLRVANSVN